MQNRESTSHDSAARDKGMGSNRSARGAHFSLQALQARGKLAQNGRPLLTRAGGSCNFFQCAQHVLHFVDNILAVARGPPQGLKGHLTHINKL